MARIHILSNRPEVILLKVVVASLRSLSSALVNTADLYSLYVAGINPASSLATRDARSRITASSTYVIARH